jgi:hypothetical protein
MLILLTEKEGKFFKETYFPDFFLCGMHYECTKFLKMLLLRVVARSQNGSNGSVSITTNCGREWLERSEDCLKTEPRDFSVIIIRRMKDAKDARNIQRTVVT